MEIQNKATWLDWMALVLLMLIWGSSFILIKRTLISFSPVEVGFARISISFLVLWPFLIGRLNKIPRRMLIWFALAGLIGNGLPPFLFARAQTVIDSYLAGVINALTPLFTLLLGLALFGTRTRWMNVTGVIMGLGGAVGLLAAAHQPGQLSGLGYSLFAVAAAICYALNMNIIKTRLSGFDALTITSVAFMFIGLPSLLMLFTATSFVSTMAHTEGAWISLGYLSILSVVGTALAMIIHNWMIRRTSALFASTVTYMMPLVAIGWGLIDGERFLPAYLPWILLILGGVYLSNRRKARRPAPLPAVQQ